MLGADIRVAVMTSMSIGTLGLNLIKSFEGLRLTAYKDVVGIWTIGYGHTLTAKSGMVIDQACAESLLRADLIDAQEAVDTYVKVPLTQYQYDALVSLVFNIGTGAFSRSTLCKRINAREDQWRIGAEFLRWVYAGGKKIKGLENRRIEERKLYLGLV